MGSLGDEEDWDFNKEYRKRLIKKITDDISKEKETIEINRHDPLSNIIISSTNSNENDR